jgi:hypothetical protein
MVIFHSYVSLPEGNWELFVPDGSEKSLQMVVSLGCAHHGYFSLKLKFQEWFMVFPLGMRMG